MRKIINLILLVFCGIFVISAKDPKPFLETRYHNPVDTLELLHGNNKSLILFVHSYQKNCSNCATKKWQYALQNDTLNILRDNGIHLYIVYESCSQDNVKEFDSNNNTDATFIVDSERSFRNIFPDNTSTTPYLIAINNGIRSYILGGSLSQMYQFVEQSFEIKIVCHDCNGTGIIKKCSRCNGTGRITPRRNGGPDESVGICPQCGGKGFPTTCQTCRGLGIIDNKSQ